MDSKLYTQLYTQPDTATAPESPPGPSLRETVHAKLRASVLDGEFGPRERSSTPSSPALPATRLSPTLS
ncbi:hypothetical protein AB0D14_17270 [Streptomyces sp. NPDC048484]|uniref:hypothetical protein n=1 Tax=Streptomyces sp. NPDC048484 TaxID=3155146 RepID=UPI00343C555F